MADRTQPSDRHEDSAASSEVAALFQTIREQVIIREKPVVQGFAPHPMIDPNIAVTLDEAKAILAVYDAAQECANWHMAQGSKHITDVKLWESVTGRDRRATPEGVRTEGGLTDQERTLIDHYVRSRVGLIPEAVGHLLALYESYLAALVEIRSQSFWPSACTSSHQEFAAYIQHVAECAEEGRPWLDAERRVYCPRLAAGDCDDTDRCRAYGCRYAPGTYEDV